MTGTDLISPAYLDEQKRLHADPRGYGQRGRKWAVEVNSTRWVHGCQSVLDYGCGSGSLAEALKWESALARFTVSEYDPAIPEKSALPVPADLVVCTDVLEHIENDRIDSVLDHLASLATKAIFLVVSLVETSKVLSDGRQAHILLMPREWWREQFEARGFSVVRDLEMKKPDKAWGAVLRRAI